MKKLRYALILVLVMVIASGCGEKKLTCKLEGKDLGKKLTQNMEVYFQKEEVVRVKSKIETTYEEDYKEEIDTSYKALEEGLKAYKEEDGITSKISKEKDTIIVELDFDIKKQKEKAKDMSGINTEATKEEIKNDFEKEGYTCN